MQQPKGELRPFAYDLYPLLPKEFEPDLSLLISINLMFGAPLWPGVQDLALHLGGIKRKSLRAEDLTPTKLAVTEFKNLIHVVEDNVILSVKMVMNFNKRAKRTQVPLLPALVLNSLTVTRIMLKIRLEGQERAVFIFAEKGVGQEAYKMDARYLPLIGLQGAEVVPDISILEPLLHADEFKVFILQ